MKTKRIALIRSHYSMQHEHKGSECYCQVPLQGPPEHKKRQKCHNYQDTAFQSCTLHVHAAHQDNQFSLRPSPRAGTRQELGTPAEQDSAWGYIIQQPHFCHCLSLMAHTQFSWAALRSTTLTAQAQTSRSIVLWTTSKVFPGGQLLGHCPSGSPGHLPQVWCLRDRHTALLHQACQATPPIGTGTSQCERKASPNRLTSNKYVWQAPKKHYETSTTHENWLVLWEFLDTCLTCEQKDSPETQNSSCGLRGGSQATAQFFHGIKHHHGTLSAEVLHSIFPPVPLPVSPK